MSMIVQTMTGTSPAAPGSSTTSAILVPKGYYDTVVYTAALQGATGGTLDVFVQTTFDDGASWWDIGHFTQLAAAGPAVKYIWQTTQNIGANAVVSGDAVMAAGTFASGPPGSQLRLKFVAGTLTTAGSAQIVNAAFIRRDAA